MEANAMIALAQSVPLQMDQAWQVQISSTVEGAPPVNAPWRYAALAQLRTLEESGQNRPGQGDLRISDATSSHARQILAQMDITDAPTPEVVPISGGGIAISWSMANRELQLSVFADGEVVLLKTQDQAILEEPDERGLRNTYYIDGLKWLLGRAG